MPIKTLILDLDGPLLDGKQRHYRCYSDILKKYNFTPIPIEEYWRMKRAGINRQELLKLSRAESIYEIYLPTWLNWIEEKEYLSLDILQPQVLQLLQQWRAQQINVLLISMRQHSENLYWQLQQLKITEVINQITVTANKAATIQAYFAGKDLASCLWIGDTELDIQAAREVGIKICAVTCGLRDADYLKKFAPDFLREDLVDTVNLIETVILSEAKDLSL